MKMQQVWIGAYITMALMITHVYTQDLRISVTPSRSRYSAKEHVLINLKYKNTGPTTLHILKWYLPNEILDYPLFNVALDGQSVKYTGPLIKREAPTIADTVALKSGEEVSTVVRLSSAYDITKTGTYSVQVELSAASILFTSAGDVKTEHTTSDAVGQSVLQSAPVTLFAVGRPNAMIKENPQQNTQLRVGTHTYIGCSKKRRSLIRAGIKMGRKYSSSAVTYLKSLDSSVSERYVTWFGLYSSKNLGTVREHFTNINNVFRSKPMTFDCGCDRENVFAYVYRDGPYKIWLCPAFWTAPVAGTDSKGGTLVHEISHFTVVAGTDDYTYGQTKAMALAKEDPDKAVFNADNHEYFAENNPALR
jgi:peptidyl-Lys metalloendopeptidase